MRTTLKILLTLLPLMVWGLGAGFFEWSWHGVDSLHDTGRGFGAAIVYRLGLIVALVLTAIFSLFLFFLGGPRRGVRYAWALFAVGAFMPFVVFGGSGYFGFPNWRNSWFSPFSIPLMGFGLLCCLSSPFLAAGSFWRRLTWAGVAFFGFAAATLVASFSTLISFGPPMD